MRGSVSVLVKQQHSDIPLLHKTDSDLRKADIAIVLLPIPFICILRNSPVHGT